MGQNIQKSLSCVDCASSRVVTLEDQDSSCYIKNRDFRTIEENDEVTVFESPIKVKKNKLYKSLEECDLDFRKNMKEKINRRLYTNSEKRFASVKTNNCFVDRKIDEFAGSEISTPSMVMYGSRYRTFSSNYSPISVNIVESIRKNSFSSNEN